MKFANLLKKELTELINKQMIIGIVIICALFMIVGQVMKQSIDEITKNEYKINICDMDNTDFTASIIDELEKAGAELRFVNEVSDDYSETMKKNELDSLVVIPKGFTNDIFIEKKFSSLKSISVMKSTSSLSAISGDTSGAVSLLQSVIRDKIMTDSGFSAEEIALIQTPFLVDSVTVVADKSAGVDMFTIIQNLTMQNMIIPIIIFMLVMYTSQMIINAISTEKIDKTLETLLSAPVSRSAVLGAKMLGASIVALINAVVFMIGYSVFVGGAVTSVADESLAGIISESISYEKAMEQLGLTLGFTDYLLIGIQMFLTILISLSVSIILGAMANDSKSAQNLVMPVAMCAIVPYMISMVSDINQLPAAIRTVVYAIPFTHTFTAMSNLIFDNTNTFIFGLIYQAIFFAFCMFFAVRLFSSDRIFTASLSFGKKSRLSK